MIRKKNKSVDRGTRMMALCVMGVLCVLTSAIMIPLLTPDFEAENSQGSSALSSNPKELPASAEGPTPR